MTDTQTVPTETREWGSFKNYDESNREYVLPQEDAGYVLRIDKVAPPTLSPFPDFDEKGKEKPRAWQTLIHFTIVDYANDNPDPTQTIIGQTISQYYRISMHTKANFYKLAKAAFGGVVDPTWKPNKVDLEGQLIAASIEHKKPNAEGRVYPKPGSVAVYRGRNDYLNIPTGVRAPVDEDDDGDSAYSTSNGSSDDVPF